MAFQLATNLNLGAQLPLDARSVVANQTERNALVASGKAYAGLIVYVTGENKYYYYNTGNQWVDFGSSQNLVYATGDQTISGVKNFISRPTINGTGVLLSGESYSIIEINYNYFSNNITLGSNYINLGNSATGITANLPVVVSGVNYIVKNLNTGIITLTGSNLIDGYTNLKLYKNESAHLLGVNNIGYTGWVTLNTNGGIS